MLLSDGSPASLGAQLLLKAVGLSLDVHEAHECGPREERTPQQTKVSERTRLRERQTPLDHHVEPAGEASLLNLQQKKFKITL